MKDKRHPFLIEEKALAERVRAALNHRFFEGVSVETAEEDAHHFAIYKACKQRE